MVTPVQVQPQANSNVTQEDWDAVNRFTALFNETVHESEFGAACEQAFALAIDACEQGLWNKLKERCKEMQILSIHWKTSLLNHLIAQGEQEWVKQLIVNQIDLHTKDADGNNPLHIAAKYGREHMIEYLKYIDIDALNNKQQAPLHIAIEYGHPEFVKAILNKRANVNRLVPVDQGGILKLNALELATMRGQNECVKQLAKWKKPSSCFSSEIGNLLHMAVYFHQLEMLQFLLENYRAELDIESKNRQGLTPLCLAASLNEQSAVYLLFFHRASIHAKDENGQLPIHHAAIGCHYNVIDLLGLLGSKIKTQDSDGNRPIDLLGQGDAAEACRGLLKNLCKGQAQGQLQMEKFLPPLNLVFKGGGAKGLGLVGGLIALQEKNLLEGIERVAGTSAGAITAAFAAIGYPINKMEELLKKTDLIKVLLDHPLSAEKLSEATGDIFNVIKTLQYVLQVCKNPMKLVTDAFKALYQCTGICDGEKFRLWMEEHIFEQTKIADCTFGELAEEIRKGAPFKHLHVYATRVGNNPEIVHISSEDSKWKDIVIADAIRMSMSIPGVFKPHIIHIKNSFGKRVPDYTHGSFLDGGMLYNFPVETFDQKQYFTKENLGKEGQCPKFNKRTLGFSLFSSLDTHDPVNSQLETIFDLLFGIVKVYMKAEDAIRQLNPYNKCRVIEIDVKDVGSLSFNASNSKKTELVNSGKEATRNFLENYCVIQLPSFVTPEFQKIKPGLNIEGICTNDHCAAARQKVVTSKGKGTHNLGEIFSDNCCPSCNDPVEPILNIILSACTFSYKGVDDQGEPVHGKATPESQTINVEGWKSMTLTIETLK